MESFAEACRDERVRAALLTALSQHRPFRRFKDTVESWLDVRQAWFAYKEQAEREIVKDWLRQHGVEAEHASPRRPKPVAEAW